MSAFLNNIQQHQLEWRGAPLLLPVFCYDNTSLSAIFTASTQAAKRLLPNVDKLKLVEVFPGRCLLAINCFQYRRTDIGPYNEVAISLVVKYGGIHIPGFSALGQMARRQFNLFVWQLPVTTEVARDGGLEIYGYPKFLADVVFATDHDRASCTVTANEQLLLKLEGPALPTKQHKPLKVSSYSVIGDIPLKANIVQNPIELGLSVFNKQVSLQTGEHPIGQTLAELKLSSRALAYLYSPKNESILFAAKNMIDS